MKPVNNEFYEELGERWYTAQDDPVALLRAESKLKLPWVLQVLGTGTKGPMRLLDIGCGAGFLTNGIARVWKNSGLEGEIFGVDLSEESMNVARARDTTRSVRYLKMSAEALDFEDQSFDAVFAMDFLEHVEKPERVIREVARLLKPGGKFFFHTFNRNCLSTLVVIKGVEWFVKNTPDEMHVSHLFIKPAELEKYCQESGLRVVEMRGVAPRFFSWAFLKLLITRTVSDRFEFVFTKSTLISYSGYATRT
jgi:2-polyprenyl-6-hydroxyphenyl methylase/3-demethylubiquinone-9 3-methyltransferase